MNAPELYAISQSDRCAESSRHRCYWCGGNASSNLPHKEPRPAPFQRSTLRFVACPSEVYQCRGCWLFRRGHVTIPFLSSRNEDWKDARCPLDYSWLITPHSARAIRLTEDAGLLYETLLEPPLTFALSIISEERRNPVQMAPVNDIQELLTGTVLAFAVDGIVMSYSPHELERVLSTNDVNGLMPGTARLYSILGPYQLTVEKQERRAIKESGRPKETVMPAKNQAEKVLKRRQEPVMSGV
jgi:hypothetical protein